MELVSWKFDKFKSDAQSAYAEISALQEITPENVVELARNDKSAIHNDFEWNDTIAGEKYRRIQAAEMIRMLVITPVEKDNEPTRVFEITTKKNTYEPVQMIVRKPDEYQSLLKRALSELREFEKRYRRLSELEAVFAEINAL